MTTRMLALSENMTPTESHSKSSLRGRAKSRSGEMSDSFLTALFFFLGSGLPPGPSCSGRCEGRVSLSLRAVTMLRTVKVVR